SYADSVADLDGDGAPEIVAFASTTAWVYDGRTGMKIRSGRTDLFDGYPLGFSTPYGIVTTDVADLDADGAQEVIGYTNNSYSPDINSRAVFVVDWNAARPTAQRLSVRWRHGVASLTDDTHVYVDNGVADLDGDGRAEVTSTFVSGGVGTTNVWSG